MIFRLKMRSLFAIVAHCYNCLRAFFSRLDKTHAHCADEVEMSFVCVHTNVSLAGRCLDCVVAKPYAVEKWRDFTDQDTHIASAEIFAIFYHKWMEIIRASSRNAGSFSLRTTNRFPSSRWVRPLGSTAETQPQLQPASFRLSAIVSHYFTQWDSGLQPQ